jgi:hypothetical protein
MKSRGYRNEVDQKVQMGSGLQWVNVLYCINNSCGHEYGFFDRGITFGETYKLLGKCPRCGGVSDWYEKAVRYGEVLVLCEEELIGVDT